MKGLEMKYFVLNPNKNNAYGKASRRAIEAYSLEISEVNLKLSRDLNDWMCKINHKIMEDNQQPNKR